MEKEQDGIKTNIQLNLKLIFLLILTIMTGLMSNGCGVDKNIQKIKDLNESIIGKMYVFNNRQELENNIKYLSAIADKNLMAGRFNIENDTVYENFFKPYLGKNIEVVYLLNLVEKTNSGYSSVVVVRLISKPLQPNQKISVRLIPVQLTYDKKLKLIKVDEFLY